MVLNILRVLEWNASLGVKFFRVVSFHTLLIVFFTLVSQLSTLLASFLPLKVIILLGSEGVPGYFPSFLSGLNRDVLIAGLSIATLGFFVVHLLAERLVIWFTSLGTNQLLAKSHKMVLFENQDQVATGGYHRYSRALAGGVFIALSLVGMGWLYFDIVLVLLGYASFALTLLCLLHRHSSIIQEKLETSLREMLNLITGIGFFVTFGYLVWDFIFWNEPGVIVAIVTLILSRQMMTRITGLVVDLTTLYQQKEKLNALFFHGKVLLNDMSQKERSVWSLMQPDARQKWINALLKELSNNDEYFSCEWHQTGQANVLALKVENNTGLYLVKLFAQNRSSFALHEATLMSEKVSGLPSARFLGTTQIQKFQCLLYKLPSGQSPESGQVLEQVQPLRRQLMAADPPLHFYQRYRRSRPMLWQRLNVELLSHLDLAVTNSDQKAMLEWLLENLNSLKNILQSLPLVLHQPDFSQDAIWITDKGFPLALNWGQWSLEPLGAGWPEAAKSLKKLGPAIVEVAQIRPALNGVVTQKAELSALAFALERECNRQRYVQALALVPEMVKRMEASKDYIAFETGDE